MGSMIGGTLRVIWQGECGARIVTLDVKSRVDALMIALAIFSGSEERPTQAEFVTDHTEIFDI